MLARRLSGILTGLLMLHLASAGADLACAEHGSRPAQDHRHAMGHHTHATAKSAVTAAARADAATATEQPCETPAQAECCRAMTSCAIIAACERGARLESVPPVRDAIEPAVVRAPQSPVTSPDPPPPKA
jgi:hypothetical protein